MQQQHQQKVCTRAHVTQHTRKGMLASDAQIAGVTMVLCPLTGTSSHGACWCDNGTMSTHWHELPRGVGAFHLAECQTLPGDSQVMMVSTGLCSVSLEAQHTRHNVRKCSPVRLVQSVARVAGVIVCRHARLIAVADMKRLWKARSTTVFRAGRFAARDPTRSAFSRWVNLCSKRRS
jgi:hypothetical protein